MSLLRLTLIPIWCGLILGSPVIIEAQSKPDKRLQQKISVNLKKRHALAVIRELGEKYKLPIDLDPSLSEEGIAVGQSDGSFSLTADGVSLGSVIHMACETMRITYTIEKGRMLLKTVTSDENKLVVREYPLGALEGSVDPQFLVANLAGLTSGSWKDVDGDGGEFVAVTPQSLSIRQSGLVHAELQTLFDQMSVAISGRAPVLSAQEKTEQSIVKKLQTPVAFAGDETALPDLFEQLLRKNGVPYWIDEQSLQDEMIDLTKLNSKVEARKMPTSARLDAICAEHKLGWRVADEVVRITSATRADEQMVTRIYDLSRSGRGAAEVMEQLTSNKELGPWRSDEDDGGKIMPLGTFLVIRQNARNHARIEKLLK